MSDNRAHLSLEQATILRRALRFGGVSTGLYRFNDLYKLDKRGLLRQVSQREFVITEAGRKAIGAVSNVQLLRGEAKND